MSTSWKFPQFVELEKYFVNSNFGRHVLVASFWSTFTDFGTSGWSNLVSAVSRSLFICSSTQKEYNAWNFISTWFTCRINVWKSLKPDTKQFLAFPGTSCTGGTVLFDYAYQLILYANLFSGLKKRLNAEYHAKSKETAWLVCSRIFSNEMLVLDAINGLLP